jgi:hypothetical protein
MGVVVRSPLIYAKEGSEDEKRHPVAIQTPPLHLGILGELRDAMTSDRIF